MAKANFSKVEKALEEELIKITSQKLLDATAGKQHKMSAEDATLILKKVKTDLIQLNKEDKEIYKKVGVKQSALKKLLSSPETLTPSDWNTIREIQKKVTAFKKDLQKKLPPMKNEELVEKERIIQKDRRFNVRSKWIPLE
jgi:hypothetical protein